MKTVKLSSFTQNPDNPQKYGGDEIASLVLCSPPCASAATSLNNPNPR